MVSHKNNSVVLSFAVLWRDQYLLEKDQRPGRGPTRFAKKYQILLDMQMREIEKASEACSRLEQSNGNSFERKSSKQIPCLPR